MTALHLDYESKSEIDLKTAGFDRYSADSSTEIMMMAWAFDNDDPVLWEKGRPFPKDVRRALEAPDVEKWAFNAQFERVMTKRKLGIETPYEGWRCTMALAYMQSFTGGLEDIGRQMQLGDGLIKTDGKRFINMFCKPQRITKNQPLRWRDEWSDPEEWQQFGEYCVQDVVAERAIKRHLIKYEIDDIEWWLYEVDQVINDRGIPMDMLYVQNAIRMAKLRKEELIREMKILTGLANPNSTQQLIPWLQDRGYPFSDLKKDTVKKVLTENEELEKSVGGFLSGEAVPVLKLRRQASRTSVRKYNAVDQRVGEGDRLRFSYQFGGASRTNRWAGRGFQQHNLPRTPKYLEEDKKLGVSRLTHVTDIIREDDYEQLCLYVEEPMDALAGCVRSAIRAPDGYEIRVCDLASIETRVSGALAGCDRLLNVFAEGKDAYVDFGQFMFSKTYEEVTKQERQEAKPAVLGCCYGLGGGELRDGKRTGLWGYAESMGVNLDLEACHRAVSVYRETYSEIVDFWWETERQVVKTIRTGKTTTCGPLTFFMRKPYLCVRLPSGRIMYYHKPRVHKETRVSKRTGKNYDKDVISYMGKSQITLRWQRIATRGAKFFENFVQAIARDVLREMIIRAWGDDFPIIGHVHDELMWLARVGDNYYTVDRMEDLMREPLPWWPQLILDADGYAATFYRK